MRPLFGASASTRTWPVLALSGIDSEERSCSVVEEATARHPGQRFFCDELNIPMGTAVREVQAKTSLYGLDRIGDRPARFDHRDR
jgi:hypothetical protein